MSLAQNTTRESLYQPPDSFCGFPSSVGQLHLDVGDGPEPQLPVLKMEGMKTTISRGYQ
jgi:hypothetical protein